MFDIEFTEVCVSTSKMLLERMERGENLPDLYTLRTDFQTAGYGQIGNHWESERGENLLFSTVLHPTGVKATEQFFISEAIALSITEMLEKFMGAVSVKWPNDIYWFDYKLAGILIENNLSGSGIKDCVIGVGLNVNQTIFHSDAPNPFSMRNVTGDGYNLEWLLTMILDNFQRLYAMGLADREELHKKYMAKLFKYGVESRYSDAAGEFTGTITSVEPDGHLHITDSEGRDRRYAFKEVSYIL